MYSTCTIKDMGIYALHILSALLLAILKIVCLLVAIAYFTLAERKIMAAVQRRVGPNVVGPFGLLQPLADGLKLAGKELTIPAQASSRIFLSVAITVLLFALSGWSAIPFGMFDHSEHMGTRSVAEVLALTEPNLNMYKAAIDRCLAAKEFRGFLGYSTFDDFLMKHGRAFFKMYPDYDFLDAALASKDRSKFFYAVLRMFESPYCGLLYSNDLFDRWYATVPWTAEDLAAIAAEMAREEPDFARFYHMHDFTTIEDYLTKHGHAFFKMHPDYDLLDAALASKDRPKFFSAVFRMFEDPYDGLLYSKDLFNRWYATVPWTDKDLADIAEELTKEEPDFTRFYHMHD